MRLLRVIPSPLHVLVIRVLPVFLVLSASVPAFAGVPEFWNDDSLPASLGSPDAAARIWSVATGNGSAPVVYDESYNFQPGLNLYQEAAQLSDLYGSHGSQLCAPIAITHAMAFLKTFRRPGFPQLARIADVDRDGTADTYRDRIRYFFSTCNTDRNDGTKYDSAVQCIRKYIAASGYTPWAYQIGPHALSAPPGHPLTATKHVLTVSDIRTYGSQAPAFLLMLGWYHLDPVTHAWVRQGGHFVDVYGYDYSRAWGERGIVLKVVNSWVNYLGRERGKMYDDVTMTRLPAIAGQTWPVESQYELKGTGFAFAGTRALVEDILIALPYPKGSIP